MAARVPYGLALPLSIAVVVLTAVLARFIEPAIYLYAGAGVFLILVIAYVSSRMREVRAGAETKRAEAWSLATELGARGAEVDALSLALEEAKAEAGARRDETERERERFDVVAEASRVLSGSSDSERALQELTDVASRSFADFCSVDLITTSGSLSTTSSTHSGGRESAEAAGLKSSPALRNSIARAVKIKAPVLVTEEPAPFGTGATEQPTGAGNDSRLHSLIVVPLVARGRVLGAITFARSSARSPYEDADLPVAKELAIRAALSLEATRLLHNARAELADRIEAERAMRESEVRFRTMADSAPVMIWTADERGAFDFCNRRWLEFTGRPIERELGDGWADGVHADDRERCLTELSEALFAQQPFRVEYRLLRHDGTYRWILQSGAPRLTEDGGCAGLIGSCIDIEEQLARSTAAREASRAKSGFLAVMSHELRTPLNAILGYSDLLDGEVSGPLTDAQRLHLTRIRMSVKHLSGLIDQILSLSRIEAGKEPVHDARVNAAAIAREAAALTHPSAHEKHLYLRADLPLSLEVSTDPGKLRQILLNLLANSVRFTDQGGVILRLRAEPAAENDPPAHGGRMVFEVEDTGIGIAAADQSRVFDAFTQVDQTTTRRAGGAGLGLAVSRQLAHLLGGELTLRSTPGVGTTFTLTLPLHLSRNPPTATGHRTP